jgi:hypothetical protein
MSLIGLLVRLLQRSQLCGKWVGEGVCVGGGGGVDKYSSVRTTGFIQTSVRSTPTAKPFQFTSRLTRRLYMLRAVVAVAVTSRCVFQIQNTQPDFLIFISEASWQRYCLTLSNHVTWWHACDCGGHILSRGFALTWQLTRDSGNRHTFIYLSEGSLPGGVRLRSVIVAYAF